MSTPREEMNTINQIAVEFAMEQIAEHGEFIPFAVVIQRDGNACVMALDDDQVEDGGPEDIAHLCEALQADAEPEGYRASAIVSDVRIRIRDTGETTDAVRLQLEHVDDEPVTCIYPYRRDDEGIDQHIDPFIEPGERLVFPK